MASESFRVVDFVAWCIGMTVGLLMVAYFKQLGSFLRTLMRGSDDSTQLARLVEIFWRAGILMAAGLMVGLGSLAVLGDWGGARPYPGGPLVDILAGLVLVALVVLLMSHLLAWVERKS